MLQNRYFKVLFFILIFFTLLHAENIQGEEWTNSIHGSKSSTTINSCPDGERSIQGTTDECQTKDKVALSLYLEDSIDCSDNPLKIQKQGTRECTADSKTIYLENTQLNIEENVTTANSLGTLSIVHFGDGSEISSYKLLGDGNSSFAISASGELLLKDGVELDYETIQNYNLRVQVTTYRGTSNEVDLNLTILNIDKAPVISVVEDTITILDTHLENDPIGTINLSSDNDILAISSFKVIDDDLIDVSHEFNISNDGTITLQEGAYLNHSLRSIYHLSITAKNSVGDSNTIELTIVVNQGEREGPTITINGPSYLKVTQGSYYKDANATAKDANGDDVTVSSVGDINTSKLGLQSITYTAKDDDDHSTTATRRVEVVLAIVKLKSPTKTYITSFIFEGDKGWIEDTSIYNTSPSSMVNDNIEDNQKACMKTTLNLDANSTIGYNYKVSSEKTFDLLKFYVNNKENLSVSGNVSWSYQEYNTSIKKEYEFKWCYKKDGSEKDGSDSAWVDDVFISTPLKAYADMTGGEVLGVVQVFDGGIVEYFTLIGDGSQNFNISASGVITLKDGVTLSHEDNPIYYLTVTATNSGGTSQEVEVIISVGAIRPQEPSITLNGEKSVIIEKDTNYEDAGATAFDAQDGNLTSSITEVSNDVNSSKEGTYSVVYIVEDSDGNEATATRKVTVIHTRIMPLLVVRIEFNDYQFNSSASVWASKIFGTDKGQLNHYYNEISYSKFQFEAVTETGGTTNDGIITVKLNKDHPGNDEFGDDELVSALSLADEYIDFSNYDKNKNDILTVDEFQVVFLVAGGESSYNTNPGIWAHSSCIVTDETFDSVKVANCDGDGEREGKYSRFGEKHDTHDATIGIIAHELGHSIFDLPDLYDIDNDSEGIGIFGLMSGGSWNKTASDNDFGETPAHMTGWSKVFSGFVKAEEINENRDNLTLSGAATKDYKLYKIKTSLNNEYFLIENRSAEGYDQGLDELEGVSNYTGGLLILHVDENKKDNKDQNHKWVDVEEANNAGLDDKSHQGHINNLYFNGNKTEFTPQTTPNSNTYDGESSGISITNISDSGSTMSVDITME